MTATLDMSIPTTPHVRTYRGRHVIAKREGSLMLVFWNGRDAVRDNAEPAEIYEWWAVDSWLFEYLRDNDEPVIDAGNLKLWGRCCTGQAIMLDPIIARFALSRPDAWWWKTDA
jgi:hypothetical protein